MCLVRQVSPVLIFGLQIGSMTVQTMSLCRIEDKVESVSQVTSALERSNVRCVHPLLSFNLCLQMAAADNFTCPHRG
jgi:hypothetical protein